MKRNALIIGMTVLLAGCGSSIDGSNSDGQEKEESQTEESEANSVSGREIIAGLEQTTEETAIRDELAAEVRETKEFKEGYMGEPTDELAEDLAVQRIEGMAATEALNQVYGGHEGVDKAGVVFYENQQTGAEQSGFWFGVKEPDERLDEWLAILQEKVDAGEILAEPIYVYQSPHSQEDLKELMYKASKILRPMQEANHNADAAVYNLSADTITGAIEVGHNFLTEAQIKELVQAFPEREVELEEVGRRVPAPGEPDVSYPDPATVTEPSSEGSYLIEVMDDRILAVHMEGGATYYSFTDAAEKLEVGQRVKVSHTGSIAASDPGQGTAVFVEVLPAYQPEEADLNAAEVVRKALDSVSGESNWVTVISGLAFDETEDRWTVEISRRNKDEEVSEVKVPDEE